MDASLPPDLTSAGLALRDGRLSAARLLAAVTARAEAIDPRFGVYLTRFDAYAARRAEAMDAELARGADRGPLQGIPLAVKDLLAMREGPTTAQSRALEAGWEAGRDAAAVAAAKAAGAVITGKTTTMELAIGLPDPESPFPLPRNPWNPEAWTGGSSSGSAAAVAAGLALAAIGTDTTGSIRIPAAFCGVTGLVPTFGLTATAGCLPLAASLDRVGPLARSARDCGTVLALLRGEQPAAMKHEGGAELGGLRVGVERRHSFGAEREDPQARGLFEAAIERLAELGAEPVEVSLGGYEETVAATWTTMIREAYAFHREALRQRREQFSPATAATLELGARTSAAEYEQAQRVRRAAAAGLEETFATVDLVAMPTATFAAPTFAALAAEGMEPLLPAVQVLFWSVVANPVLALPIGFNRAGMPFGLQLAGRPFEERLLVRCGDAYQRTTEWHLGTPAPVAAALAG